MPRPTIRAPYEPGDRIRTLITSRDGGICMAVVTIDRVTPLSNGRTWRIAGNRPGQPHPDPARDCPRVEWIVDATGADVDTAAPNPSSRSFE